MNKYSIGFYGDLTTGENYHIKSEISERVNVLRQYGYDWLFNNVKCLLERFDFNIVNLESPLTNCLKSELQSKKSVLHWMDPNICGKLLKKYHINAVTLGNNHGYDYGEQGLIDTIDELNKQEIAYFGAGLNEQEAKKPFYMEIPELNNKKIYVFGGYKYRDDYDEDFKFYAKDEKSGVNLLTGDNAQDAIKEIKDNDSDSIVIMFPHFGFDLLKTTDLQIEYAHKFIDAGADYVIGHGPHMMNSIERYKDKTILYGIGNFIFPASFKNRVEPFNMVAQLELSEDNNHKLYIYPTFMDNYSNEAQTRLIKKQETNIFVDLLLENSNIGKEALNIENIDDVIRIGL